MARYADIDKFLRTLPVDEMGNTDFITIEKTLIKAQPDEIIELVRAKDEGRVIVPPVKIGQTVYEIQPIRKRVQAYEITTIKYNGKYWWFTWILKDRKGIYGNVEGFSSHQIGETVFLTKELAEEALKNEQEKL